MTGLNIRFDKPTIQAYLDALRGGRPISPPPGGWGSDEALMLAGACLACLRTDSMVAHRPAVEGGPPERAEAEAEPMTRLVEAAVEHHAVCAIQMLTDVGVKIPDGTRDMRLFIEGDDVVFDPPLFQNEPPPDSPP